MWMSELTTIEFKYFIEIIYCEKREKNWMELRSFLFSFLISFSTSKPKTALILLKKLSILFGSIVSAKEFICDLVEDA